MNLSESRHLALSHSDHFGVVAGAGQEHNQLAKSAVEISRGFSVVIDD